VCSAKIEKEKKQLAKDAGFVKTEVSGAEVNEILCVHCLSSFISSCGIIISVIGRINEN